MSFVFIHSDFFPDWWFNTFSSISPDSVPLAEALLQSCTTRPRYNWLMLVIVLSVGQISCLVWAATELCSLCVKPGFCVSWSDRCAVSALMVCYWPGLHGTHQVMFYGISWFIGWLWWWWWWWWSPPNSATPPPPTPTCWIFCGCNKGSWCCHLRAVGNEQFSILHNVPQVWHLVDHVGLAAVFVGHCGIPCTCTLRLHNSSHMNVILFLINSSSRRGNTWKVNITFGGWRQVQPSHSVVLKTQNIRYRWLL